MSLLKKTGLWLTLSGLVLFAVFSVTKINPDENINKLLPEENGHQLIDLKQFNTFTERIFFVIYLKNNNEYNVDSLIAYGDSLNRFLDSLKTRHRIARVDYEITGDQGMELFDVFYGNLPVFLEEEDYRILDTLLTERNIIRSVKAGYRTLLSPAGMMYRDIFIRDPLNITQILLNRLKKLTFSDNLTIAGGHLFSRDRDKLIFSMVPAATYNETKTNLQLFKAIDREILKLNKRFKGMDARYFGAPVVAAGNSEQIRKDITLTVSIAFILIFALIYYYFRRFEYVFLIVLPALMGGILALAILVWIKNQISVISLGVGAILLGITVDYALHVLNHYSEKKSTATLRKDLWSPVLMSAITTISAFLCLLALHTEALTDLALFASISILIAAVFSLFILPYLIRKTKSNGPTAHFSRLESWSHLKIFRRRILAPVIVLTALITILFPGQITFDKDLDHINYMSERTIEARDMLDPILGVSHKNIILITRAPHFKNALDANEKIFARYGKMVHSRPGTAMIGISSILRSDSVQRLRIDRWHQYWTDEKITMVKRTLLEQSRILGIKPGAFRPFFHLLTKEYQPLDPATAWKTAQSILPGMIERKNGTVRIINILRVPARYEDQAIQMFSHMPDIEAFSKKEMIKKLVAYLKTSFSELLWLSMTVVFLVLLLFLGRLELAFIGFIPIILSWMVLTAIMKIFGIQFNIVNIIVSTFIFGLGVDYSIFILKGLMQKYATGRENLRSFKKSILLSAATTIIGIGVLYLARHPALRSIAVVAVPGILSVLIITFTVEPVLFRHLIYSGRKKRWVPLTFSDMWLSFFGIGTFILGSLFVSFSVFIISVLPLNLKKRKLLLHRLIQKLTWFLIFFRITIKTRFINDQRKSLKTPALIISNHQSPLDIPVLLSFYPKLIILTKDWVQKTWIFRFFVKFADYHDMTSGLDDQLLKTLRSLVNDGYSIVVFPEGTRSETGRILRFKKGAFLLAEKLKLDILPVIIHGSWRCLPKGEPVVRSGLMTVSFLDRVQFDDPTFGHSLLERSKAFRKLFIDEYGRLKAQIEKPEFFRTQLIRNYIYKGPVLEWYLRVKLNLENNYEQFDRLLPRNGLITDLGCGYGFMTLLLHLTAENRQMLGIDYDRDKIDIAKNCISSKGSVEYRCEDITASDPEKSAAFLISDVLHYFDYEKQKKLIARCISALEPGGIVLIREGNTEITKNHKWTLFTEFLSTKIIKFNKSGKKLYFTSEKRLRKIARENGCTMTSQRDSAITSNTIFIIKKGALPAGQVS